MITRTKSFVVMAISVLLEKRLAVGGVLIMNRLDLCATRCNLNIHAFTEMVYITLPIGRDNAR